MLAELGIEAAREGNAWVAKCPSGRHEDRKPSFRVVDEPGAKKHGLGYCFACKFGGSPVDIVRAVYGFAGNGEAARWLAEKAVGPSTNIDRLELRVKPAGRPAFRFPAEVLFLPPDAWAETPLRYLLGRGVTSEQISTWGVGYAVDGRLRGRVVFPARDSEGKPTNYAARTYCGQLLRYLSASAEEGPDPDAVFGENLWPRIDARRTVVVAEGALNAVACHQVLPEHPVGALFGSKVTLGQILKLSTFERALIATDPDPAGDQAAERLYGALCRHVEVLRARFPRGEDAASLPPAVRRETLERCLGAA